MLENLPEFRFWQNHTPLKNELIISGNVVKGFGRGSKQLGVPTANIEMTYENQAKTVDLIPGVYCAVVRLDNRRYIGALSIGWNPVYNNAEKTVEVYVYGISKDFYGESISVDIKSFIRAEALFSGFDELIWAI